MLTCVLWFASIPAVALCASVLWPSPSYHLDIAANLGAQWVLLAVVLGIVSTALGRRRLGVVCLVAAIAPAVVLITGRASILPLPEVDPKQSAQRRQDRGALVRVIHFNTSANQSDERVLTDFAEWDADVIAVTEPSGPLWRERSRLFAPHLPQSGTSPETAETDQPGGMLGRVAFWADDQREMLMGSGFVASRWPIRQWDITEFGSASRRVISALVESPHGLFVVLGAHPRSPRDKVRWKFGNEDVEVVAQAARKAREAGLPVIVLADLNSTPSGIRSRRLATAGLRRCKPLCKALGTWPTDAVPGAGGMIGRWPFSIAIDDALISPEWTALAWTRGESRGSDHWPIVVDLELDTQGTPAER